jgi:hypothetical protein
MIYCPWTLSTYSIYINYINYGDDSEDYTFIAQIPNFKVNEKMPRMFFKVHFEYQKAGNLDIHGSSCVIDYEPVM